MYQFLNDLLQFNFLQHALLSGILASVACGVIGTFVVVRRITYIAGRDIPHSARRHGGGPLSPECLSLGKPQSDLRSCGGCTLGCCGNRPGEPASQTEGRHRDRSFVGSGNGSGNPLHLSYTRLQFRPNELPLWGEHPPGFSRRLISRLLDSTYSYWVWG